MQHASETYVLRFSDKIATLTVYANTYPFPQTPIDDNGLLLMRYPNNGTVIIPIERCRRQAVSGTFWRFLDFVDARVTLLDHFDLAVISVASLGL